MARVVFPCDQDCWWMVKDHLVQLKQECLEDRVDLQSLAQKHQAIVDINQGFPLHEPLPWGETLLSGLVKYFRKYEGEVSQFISETFPAIIDLALEVETYLPTEGIPIDPQQKEETREISRRLCCSIVACAFLCLFPNEERGFRTKLNIINFNKFFLHLPMPSQNAKLRCILHFFNRVSAEKARLTGNIAFTRQVIRHEELPTLDTWLNCSMQLCEVFVHYEGLIEDAGCGTVEVDFANRFIGGGVLNRGRVQEEIRFTVCPELLVSLLFMEAMEENEAIIISGFEQFSTTCGYAAGLEFVGDHVDGAELDERGNRKTTLCAIDAVSYRHDKRKGSQYKDKWILRDLNKAFIGFCTPFSIPDGATSDEDFFTPEHSHSGHSELPYLSAIDRYVEDLLEQALSVALPAASRALTTHDQAGSLCGTDPQSSLSSLEHYYLHRQSSMDHLEVNFRDWYNQYRRRSSNLSDLSSRRSSCDIASRRSSACSARGYSSEFSSEFEEYFDNFQLQEHTRYKYHTIKEEVGSSAVIEFAANLAASLLREGAHEAAMLCPSPQSFQEVPPEDEGVERPTPVRISSSSAPDTEVGSGDDIADNVNDNICIRHYVTDLFERMWPFCETDQHNTSMSEEIKHRIVVGCRNERINRENRELGFLGMIDNVGNIVKFNKEEEVDSSSSCSSSRHTEYSIVEVDDDILLAVADRIVAVAFQEALLECKYTLNMTKNRICHSFSESSQSDHSMDAKDQSEASLQDITNQSLASVSNELKPIDPAVRMAEKMMSGIFSHKDVPNTSEKSSFIAPNERNVVETDSAIPYQEDCDSVMVVVEPVPHPHSSTSSDNVSQKQLDMYSRIADRILHGGLTTGSTNKSASQCNVGSRPSAVTSNSSCDQTQYSSHSVSNTNQSVSSANEQSHTASGRLPSNQSTTVCHLSPKRASKPKDRDSLNSRSDHELKILNPSAQLVCRPKEPSFEVNKNLSAAAQSYSSGAPNIAASTSKSDAKNKVDGSNNRNENSNTDSSSGSSMKVPSSSLDTSSSDSSAVLGAVGGTAPSYTVDTLRPPSQSKRTPKPGHPFITGNKKNYDQFANSLSRDLLTNAFLQVQEHREYISYPRRSSEPMQISNGAALQRLEHSVHSVNGRRGQKSKTDEDISLFDYEWMQSPRTSSGFRDPVLSKFAEELMKANVSVPPLQLLGDGVSISSSSQSVCSTMSSFRDPLLASFEEELLNNGSKPALAKTQTSWSKMKGLMCSSRQGASGNSHGGGNLNSSAVSSSSQGGSYNSHQGRTNSQGGSLNSQALPNTNSISSKGSKREMTVSMSQDSECSALSWRSTNPLPVFDVSDYADTLARRVLCEALTAIYCSKSNIQEGSPDRKFVAVDLYSELLARSVLSAAMVTAEMVNSDWLDQNKVVTWSDEMETVQQFSEGVTYTEVQYRHVEREVSCSESAHSSGDYEDALDIPYQRLEEFADVLATKVLINSVAISRREQTCNFRRQYGRPIATGNWGCGAFGGDPHLKSLLQWMAASYAGCPCMLYYTFQHHQMEKFQEVVEMVTQRGWDVSRLMQVVRRYCITTCEEIEENGAPKRELFDVILQGEIFPGV